MKSMKFCTPQNNLVQQSFLTTSDPLNNLIKLLVRAMLSATDGLMFDPSHGLDKLLTAPEDHSENCFT